MRWRTSLVLSVLSVCATLALGAGSATAATLYNNAAHFTPVSVGATGSLALTSPYTWTQVITTTGNTPLHAALNTCTQSTLKVRVGRNDGTVSGTVVTSAFGGCTPFALVPTLPWTLVVQGAGTSAPPISHWNAALDNFKFVLGGATYSGNITTGVTATEPTTGTAPVCIAFKDALSFSGQLWQNVPTDGTYCFEGAAATWSLG